jgi:hypothetical protein
MRMQKAGTPVAQIRAEIDKRYGGFGPPTPTPQPR